MNKKQLNTKLMFLMPLTLFITAGATIMANMNAVLGGPSMFIFFDRR